MTPEQKQYASKEYHQNNLSGAIQLSMNHPAFKSYFLPRIQEKITECENRILNDDGLSDLGRQLERTRRAAFLEVLTLHSTDADTARKVLGIKG